MGIKIIKSLGDDRYEVEIAKEEKNEYTETQFQCVHDYLSVQSKVYLPNKDSSISDISVRMNLQVPVRSFIQVMLPEMLKHKHSHRDHLKIRGTGDDAYIPYSYSNQVVHYYDSETSTAMVAVLLKGEDRFNHVTRSMFNQFIKPNLKY